MGNVGLGVVKILVSPNKIPLTVKGWIGRGVQGGLGVVSDVGKKGKQVVEAVVVGRGVGCLGGN